MDNAKLKELVGDVLQDGLAEIAHKQPGDAVDYLGRYLLKWVAQDELEQEKAAKRAELAAALAAKQAAQAIVDVEKAALKEAEDRKQAEAEDLLASVAKRSCSTTHLTTLRAEVDLETTQEWNEMSWGYFHL
jgi:hypothetical protein